MIPDLAKRHEVSRKDDMQNWRRQDTAIAIAARVILSANPEAIHVIPLRPYFLR